LAAIRTGPLAAKKKTSLPSQSVTGFASRLTAMLPERRLGARQKQAALSAARKISPFIVIHGRSGRVTSHQPGLTNSTFYQL
jgi:hypothetical protein